MQQKSKSLRILLSILLILTIVTSIVMARGYHKPRIVYVDREPQYDPNILMLGVRVSKFGGMPIYRDSPAVLLSRSEKLALTEPQQQRIEQIMAQARQQAVSVLTEAQVDQISPIPDEPFVVDTLDRTIVSCESCSDGQCAIDEPGHSHDH